MCSGKVYLVGAGPGDPKLITVRGLELLRRADVIVHDRLANPKLLAEAKPTTKLIYCGKAASKHTLTQEEINQVLVREAKAGHLVVRLKGGDPSIFGRVGEEAEECVKHDIPFEIIPGITSGIAAPAYAGIPLTHREYNSSVAIVTGHRCAKNESVDIEWAKISGMETIVIYMGVSNLPYICAQLIEHSRDPQTPVALVRWGTTGDQQTLIGQINDIVQKVEETGFTAPAIIVVGEVVNLRKQLNWYENKLLFGHHVLVLEDPQHPDDFPIQQLEEWGASVLSLPAYDMHVVDEEKWLELLCKVEAFERIIISDVVEARFLFDFLRKHRVDIRKLKAEFIVCGSNAATVVEERGIIPTVVKTLPDSVSLDHAAEILILNQGGSGVIKSETIGESVFYYTSFYQRKYDAARVREQIVKDKVSFVVVPSAALAIDSLGDTPVLIMSQKNQWTESYIKLQLEEKAIIHN